MTTPRLALTAAAMAVASAMWSADFQAGDLYFNILDADAATVEVAAPSSGYYTMTEVSVPATVGQDGKDYTVTAVGEKAFYRSSVTKVTLPEGVTEFKDGAFESNNQLTELNFPSSLRSIGKRALYYTGLTEIILPEGLESIASYGLYNNRQLLKVVIPSTCLSLGDHMLASCDRLRDLTILSPITEIPGYFLNGNSAPDLCDIRSLTIPETVETIGDYAFAQTRLESIDIPAGVKTIGKTAFQNCVMLKTVTLHDGIGTIGGEAFTGCSALEEISIPGTATWGYAYGEYHRTFLNCSGLKKIVFEEGVTEIPNNGMAYMTRGQGSLHEVVIPSTVEKIGDDAFYGNAPWRAGASITFYGATPLDYVQSGNSVNQFPSASAIANCTIYVPAGAAEAYRAHEIWGQFANIVEMDPETPVEPDPLPEQYRNSVGDGIHPVGLTLHWGDGKAIDNLTEAVYVGKDATVADVIATALAEDPRFYTYTEDEQSDATAYGFDTNGDGTPSADYDHRAADSEEGSWKTFLNGEEATPDTAVQTGDVVTLAYCAPEAGMPATEPVFYLRPADEQGIWLPEEVVINTADGKKLTVPFLANTGDDYQYLYGSNFGIEMLDPTAPENTVTYYSSSFTWGNKEKTTCDITVSSPSDAIMRPFLNIRKDWGDGKQSVKRIYGDDSRISTIVANPLTGISLEGVEAGGTIEVDNMGVYILKPVYEPADADFTGYTTTFSDESIATLYASVNAVVAHRAGDVTLTVSSKDGSISSEYTVRVKDADPDANPDTFADGQLWLNEEWFGHTSGSINFVDAEGTFYPRVYGNANNNMAFGATSQFGTIYADRLVVMSKQAWDGGDTRPNRSGGRVVIADANTMEHLGAIDEIGGDGRSCVGVNPSKMYLGTSTGIAILNLENCTIEGNVEVTVDRMGQIGDMVKSGRYVFATNIRTGLEIIDTATDAVVKSIASTGIQGVVMSADGRVWMATTNTLTAIDPETLEASEPYSIPGSITCSSGSWRSVNLLAARKSNTLFWGNGTFYRWNLDEVEDPSALTPVYTHTSKVDDITYGNGYGTPGYDDLTDTYMYATVPGFGAAALQNWYHFVDATTGELRKRIHLPEYWWFPAMPLRRDMHAAEIDFLDLNMHVGDEPLEFDLAERVSDKDGYDKAINVWIEMPETVTLAEDIPAADIHFEGKRLTVSPVSIGESHFTIAAESNGRVSRKEVSVVVDNADGIRDAASEAAATGGEVFTTSGVHVASFSREMPELPAGVYIVVTADGRRSKILVK